MGHPILIGHLKTRSKLIQFLWMEPIFYQRQEEQALQDILQAQEEMVVLQQEQLFWKKELFYIFILEEQEVVLLVVIMEEAVHQEAIMAVEVAVQRILLRQAASYLHYLQRKILFFWLQEVEEALEELLLLAKDIFNLVLEEKVETA